MKKLCCVVSFILLTAGIGYGAANLDVGGSGAYATIQEAIDAAADGDTIRIAQGYYVENIQIYEVKNIIIQGGWSADFSTRSSDANLTTIDGLDRDRVFHISAYDEETITVVLEALKIMGGLISNNGGGIYAEAYVYQDDTQDTTINLTVDNCIVNDNQTSSGMGGAIGLYSSTANDTYRSIVNAVIQNSQFINNQALGNGGAIGIDEYKNSNYTAFPQTTYQIIGNRICSNFSSSSGGAVYINSRSQFAAPTVNTIRGNIICGNRASNNSGMYLYFNRTVNEAVELTNNIIAGNTDTGSSTNGALRIYSYESTASVTLRNNTITRNSNYGIYVDSNTSNPGVENLTVNLISNVVKGNDGVTLNEMYFRKDNNAQCIINAENNLTGIYNVNTVTFNDIVGNIIYSTAGLGDDYYPVTGSLCINTGKIADAPATDIYGNSRVGNPDIGAVEFQGSDHTAVSPPPSWPISIQYPVQEHSIVNSDPLAARYISFGDISGGTLSIRIDLPGFSAPVDVYAALYLPMLDRANLFMLKADDTVQPLSAGAVKWRANQTDAVRQPIWGDIPTSALSSLPGRYFLYVWVFPANQLGMALYEHRSYFIID